MSLAWSCVVPNHHNGAYVLVIASRQAVTIESRKTCLCNMPSIALVESSRRGSNLPIFAGIAQVRGLHPNRCYPSQHPAIMAHISLLPSRASHHGSNRIYAEGRPTEPPRRASVACVERLLSHVAGVLARGGNSEIYVPAGASSYSGFATCLTIPASTSHRRLEPLDPADFSSIAHSTGEERKTRESRAGRTATIEK